MPFFVANLPYVISKIVSCFCSKNTYFGSFSKYSQIRLWCFIASVKSYRGMSTIQLQYIKFNFHFCPTCLKALCYAENSLWRSRVKVKVVWWWWGNLNELHIVLFLLLFYGPLYCSASTLWLNKESIYIFIVTMARIYSSVQIKFPKTWQVTEYLQPSANSLLLTLSGVCP